MTRFAEIYKKYRKRYPVYDWGSLKETETILKLFENLLIFKWTESHIYYLLVHHWDGFNFNNSLKEKYYNTLYNLTEQAIKNNIKLNYSELSLLNDPKILKINFKNIYEFKNFIKNYLSLDGKSLPFLFENPDYFKQNLTKEQIKNYIKRAKMIKELVNNHNKK